MFYTLSYFLLIRSVTINLVQNDHVANVVITR